jgi:hypothetical protein
VHYKLIQPFQDYVVEDREQSEVFNEIKTNPEKYILEQHDMIDILVKLRSAQKKIFIASN